MAYNYNFDFDEESPRFALNTLWFLLGVMVFAFAVLIMTAIVSGGGQGSYYLNVQQQPSQQQTKPVTSSRGVTTTVASTPVPSTAPTRHNR